MSITTSGDNLDIFIRDVEDSLESSELISSLGDTLSGTLVDSFHASGLQSKSGATVKALEYVSDPQRIDGGWKIGVGNGDALGEEGQSAPRGTLRSFFSDRPEIRPTTWAGIPPSYKDVLESMRRSGMYGGRGPDYANYAWVQNSGNSAAGIPSTGFIDSGVSNFMTAADDVIAVYLAKVMKR